MFVIKKKINLLHVMKVKGIATDATGGTTNVSQDVAQAKMSTGRPWADAPIKVLVSNVLFNLFFKKPN